MRSDSEGCRAAEDTLPRTIVENLERGRARFGDRTLLHADGDPIGYGQFADRVEAAVDDLRAAGMRPGDRLAVCARNGLDVAVAIWACARGEFVFVGLPTALDRTGLHTLIEHSAPRLILAQPEFLPRLPASTRPIEEILTGRQRPWNPSVPLPDPETTYALVYTSGTTGTPKGARVTHRAAMHVAAFYRRLLTLGQTDVTAIHLPFSYVSGHVSQLNPMLLAGGSAVTMPEFTPKAFLDVVARYEVSVIDVVPWMFTLLLRTPQFTPDRLPSLRTAIFGGAPLDAPTGRALRARFPDLDLHEVYGMSETAGLLTAVRDGRAEPDGSVGAPADGVELRLEADGEVLARGPVVMPGYWNNPAATEAALQDGWLHTGDRGRIDPDGALRLTGRAADLINRAGLKIAPADVEDALAAHPAVVEAAAFGIPDGAAGEAVAAAVVLTDPQVTSEELRRFAAQSLPPHSRPRTVLLLDALPRTATGKVRRADLRAAAAGTTATDD